MKKFLFLFIILLCSSCSFYFNAVSPESGKSNTIFEFSDPYNEVKDPLPLLTASGFFISGPHGEILMISQEGKGLLISDEGTAYSIPYSFPSSLTHIAVTSEGNYGVAATENFVTFLPFSSGLPSCDLVGVLPTRVASLQVYEGFALIGGADGVIYRWFFSSAECNTQKSLEKYLAHRSNVIKAISHPSGNFFISASQTGRVGITKFYDEIRKKPYRDRMNTLFTDGIFMAETPTSFLSSFNGENISDALLMLNGKYLLLALQNGNIEFVQIQGLTSRAVFKIQKADFREVIKLDENSFAALSRSGDITVWEVGEIENLLNLSQKKTEQFVVDSEVRAGHFPILIQSSAGRSINLKLLSLNKIEDALKLVRARNNNLLVVGMEGINLVKPELDTGK